MLCFIFVLSVVSLDKLGVTKSHQTVQRCLANFPLVCSSVVKRIDYEY